MASAVSQRHSFVQISRSRTSNPIKRPQHFGLRSAVRGPLRGGPDIGRFKLETSGCNKYRPELWEPPWDPQTTTASHTRVQHQKNASRRGGSVCRRRSVCNEAGDPCACSAGFCGTARRQLPLSTFVGRSLSFVTSVSIWKGVQNKQTRVWPPSPPPPNH